MLELSFEISHFHQFLIFHPKTYDITPFTHGCVNQDQHLVGVISKMPEAAFIFATCIFIIDILQNMQMHAALQDMFLSLELQ